MEALQLRLFFQGVADFPQQLDVFRIDRAAGSGAGSLRFSLFTLALMATKMAIATIRKSMIELMNTPYLNSGAPAFSAASIVEGLVAEVDVEVLEIHPAEQLAEDRHQHVLTRESTIF